MKKSTADLRISIRRPVTVAMIFMGAVVFGMKSYQELALNLMPDLSYPTLTVRSEYPEAAPEEVESFVSRPLEEALSTVSNLVEIRSVSSAGVSEIILEFWWGTDMDLVSLDVREKMDRVVLPEEVERPTILRYNPALDPILRFGVYGDADLFTLRRLAEKELKPDVEGLPGVASVKVKGGLEEEVLVEVDQARLALLDITVEQVAQRLWQENINLAGGSLKEGKSEYLVRTLNEFVDLKEIGEVVIGRKGGDRDGAGAEASRLLGDRRRSGAGALIGGGEAEVKLKDVATVRWGRKEQDVITRINGLESVEVEIYKEADSNTVKVADRVKEVLGLDLGGASRAKRNRSAGLLERFFEDDPGVELKLISDPSRFIKRAIEEVRSTALLGGILALVVLFFFLRDVKSTAIIGISIPVSILVTFIPMFLFGVSLNLMSLGGLALGIGMLVDNSIVVLESIFRCREEGDGLLDASNRGTGEVASAITASTFTTVAVFFPIVFVKGIAGQLFNDLALTVTFSLLASLLVALYLIPMLASRRVGGEEPFARSAGEGEGLGGLFGSAGKKALEWLGDNGRPDRWLREAGIYLTGRSPSADSGGNPETAGTGRWFLRLYGPVHPLFEAVRFLMGCAFGLMQGAIAFLLAFFGRCLAPLLRLLANALGALLSPFLFLFERILRALDRVYPPVLGRVLRGRAAVILVCAALFVHALYLMPRLGTELIPRIHQGQFSLRIELPAGTPLEETSRDVAPVESMVLGEDRVATVFSEIGAEASGEEAQEEQRGQNTAELTVMMKDTGRAVQEEDLLIDRLREGLEDFVGIQTKFLLPSLFSFKTPVEVEIEGSGLDELRQASSRVEEAMREIPGLSDIRRSARVGNPEVRIEFDRDRLARFGMDVSTAAKVVQAKLLGEIPTQLSEGETRYDIRVRADRKHLQGLEDLWRLEIDLANGASVPLSSLAELRIVPGPSEVRRVGQRRVAVVSANLKGTDLGTVSRKIEDRLKTLSLPPGCTATLGGQNREMETSFQSLRFAMLMAVFLVYIVMASQFESLVLPLVILFSIPLGLIGVVYGLYLLEMPLSIVVFIGAIMLAGIMVNNAIVLVDYVNLLRRRGVPRDEAIVQAGRVRLRPILMTTMTTVLGLAPMALGFGEGAEIRMPMAVTVIAGLLCSTVLTLLVIPAVYALLGRRR